MQPTLAARNEVLQRCLQVMLRPIARFALSRGGSLLELLRALKIVLVQVAREQMERDGARMNVSRLSVMTGVHRKDVTQILRESGEPEGRQASFVAKVIGQWENDRRFCSPRRDPRVLTCHGPGSEFWRLVESVSSNVSPASVLVELERVRAVERRSEKVKLLRGANPLGELSEQALAVMARSVEDQYQSAIENLVAKPTPPNLFLRTAFDNIAPADLPVVRGWILERGREFHREVREYLARYDRDITPSAGNDAGAQVHLMSCSVSYEGNTAAPESSSPDPVRRTSRR